MKFTGIYLLLTELLQKSSRIQTKNIIPHQFIFWNNIRFKYSDKILSTYLDTFLCEPPPPSKSILVRSGLLGDQRICPTSIQHLSIQCITYCTFEICASIPSCIKMTWVSLFCSILKKHEVLVYLDKCSL